MADIAYLALGVGIIALMAFQPDVGSIEIGHVLFSPLLQKSRLATEAVYLLIRESFRLGNRRCEWNRSDDGCFRQDHRPGLRRAAEHLR